jgi:hypothetical protein
MTGEMINELATKLIKDKEYEVVDEIKLTLTQEQAHEIFKSHEQSVRRRRSAILLFYRTIISKSKLFFSSFSPHFTIFSNMPRVEKCS